MHVLEVGECFTDFGRATIVVQPAIVPQWYLDLLKLHASMYKDDLNVNERVLPAQTRI